MFSKPKKIEDIFIMGACAMGGGVALCVEMGFYTDISWEPRCYIEINV